MMLDFDTKGEEQLQRGSVVLVSANHSEVVGCLVVMFVEVVLDQYLYCMTVYYVLHPSALFVLRRWVWPM